jgi:hypothetical protein
VLCVCLDVWDSDKCCVFVWMCGTRTSAVCLSGCVGFRQVLCVCLDVWDSDKCCVFVWMCGTQTSAVCFSGHRTCLSPTHPDTHTALVRVPHIQTNTQHLSESHISRQTYSTCPSPKHPGDGTDTVNKQSKHTELV